MTTETSEPRPLRVMIDAFTEAHDELRAMADAYHEELELWRKANPTRMIQ